MIKHCQLFICAHAVPKAISEATREDLQSALRYLNFDIVDGHEYAQAMDDKSLEVTSARRCANFHGKLA